ncbi:hypothetical protein PBAC_28990 [Pedobacter glucosidilyticus]|nr:hypothetical protein [Pedobacter glucosidilyticus]KHJ36922.1 hypothetical protein PBAC_28990 [Pedobacter glucosidilyticus]
MKKLFLLSLIALSVSLVSCQKEEVVIKKESTDSQVIMSGPRYQHIRYDE